ncbi:MAG: S9 family peptidase [Blastocatellia bacterium]|nr:S9 family peptidase [Blastocatellia bacterium]
MCVLCAIVLGSGVVFGKGPGKPPVAKKVPKKTEIHGRTLVDDYFWMREKSNPEVISYLTAETAYADAMMAHTGRFREALYSEMLGRINETDVNVPYRQDGFYYYTRTQAGKQYPILCRKWGNLDAPEKVLLDQNEMAAGGKYFSLGDVEVSNDGHLLAYTTDTTGFRQYSLHIRDLRTNKTLTDTAERVTSLNWANDNKTLFYTQEDAVTKRSDKFYRHVVGRTGDDLLFDEKDEKFSVWSYRTRSRGYVVLVSFSSTTSENRYVSADRPGEAPTLLLPRRENHEYYVEHRGDRFYIRTNDTGKNFRLVTAPISDARVENWMELVPARKDVMLEGVECFANFNVLQERRQGVPQLRIVDAKSGESHDVVFPEPVYSISGGSNEEFDAVKYRLNYESFVRPESVYDYDIGSRKLELLKQQEVLGGYDPAKYASERIEATATDGTKVPISIVYRRDLARDGSRPLLLEGYGSYGSSNDVDFSSNRLSLLDRGVIFGIAHIRGGGEMGKEWHDQGKMMVKKNTFTDFIACADYLVAEKYTSRDRLVITGGSAGGLLMGAVTNMRPDLAKAVVTYVPYVDVINTMLDATIPLTSVEYLEWGNPTEKPAFEYMLSYSPYDNVEKKAYPTMLVRTSLNDSQVMYWEPAKYVAKLRVMKTDTNPLLFKVKLEPGGHGGASGRYDRLKDTAYDYAFILEQVGISK